MAPHPTMKAVRWEGHPESVSVKTIPIPTLRSPTDALIRITSAAICGTDLHPYHGRLAMDHPLTIGHENIGIVHALGSAITTLKPGDRVVVADLDITQDAHADLAFDAVFGIGGANPFPELSGGQAQFMLVPHAQDNLLVVPEGEGEGRELDYLLLADIWPTAWFALDRAEMVFGDTVVVFGAGPVGLLCAYSAKLRGAVRVYSVDHVPERLARAKSIGAIPINFAHGDPVQQILKLEPKGVDRCCDCCGFECINAEGENIENLILTQAVALTRTGGGIGFIGVYPGSGNPDLGASSKDARKGVYLFPVGDLFFKAISLKGGFLDPVNYKILQLLLKKLIEREDAKPSFVFDKEFSIDEAPEAYRAFSDHRLVKAVFRFEKEFQGGGEEVKATNGRDPLEGEPVKKRSRRS